MFTKELSQHIKKQAFLMGDFTTRAGKKTDYYVDKYLFETSPVILKHVVERLVAQCPPLDTFDRIAAPELGAVALAAVLSVEINKPFIIVRKEQKDYGTNKLIEGQFEKGERVIIVEDILTTGGAAIRAGEVCEKEGLKVQTVIGVVNRQEGAEENIQAKGWGVQWLLTAEQIKAS